MRERKRLALIFDFDDTLADDSTSSFLAQLGLDVQKFWRDHKRRLDLGWDPIPAYLDMMLEYSRGSEKKHRITQKKLADWGKKIKVRPGLEQFFSRVQKNVKDLDSRATVEFFIISSGIGEIISNFRFSKHFKEIWASDFAYDKDGAICGIKNVISFTDKTRFIFQIQKGLIGKMARTRPFEVNKKVSESEIHIPLDHMIFVGDGYTDVPCFSLLEKSKGLTVGVYDRDARDRWGKSWGLLSEKRVTQMVAADFKKHSGLDDAIQFNIEAILRRMRYS
jgi:phosphoserine phosphatase